jgi:hypothetical protein
VDKDPTGDISRMLDEAKLTGGHLLSAKKSMTQLVAEVRSDINIKFKAYIEARDQEMYQAGVEEGRKDG